MAFRGVFRIEYSHFYHSDLNFRHLSSYGTVVTIIENQRGKNAAVVSVTLVLGTFSMRSAGQ